MFFDAFPPVVPQAPRLHPSTFSWSEPGQLVQFELPEAAVKLPETVDVHGLSIGFVFEQAWWGNDKESLNEQLPSPCLRLALKAISDVTDEQKQALQLNSSPQCHTSTSRSSIDKNLWTEEEICPFVRVTSADADVCFSRQMSLEFADCSTCASTPFARSPDTFRSAVVELESSHAD
jgi:hypothetical protein